MALNFITTKLSILPALFQSSYDAIFSTLPFSHRWRLLLLQPINILASLITSPFWLLNNRNTILYIPTRSGRKRCLVYQPPRTAEKSKELRPVHIDIYGGGFIGGFPENNARWCTYLSNQTGAVVVSCSYRHAPRNIFPAAHDDVDDIGSWVLAHATELNADPNLLTVGGSSVGGNLALSVAQYLCQRSQNQTDSSSPSYAPKAYVGFCPFFNARLKPAEKPRPPNFPTKDPLSFLLPMYDVYGGTDRERHWENPRLNSIVADKNNLPKDMFIVAAGIDILLHEQLSFVERIKGELEAEGDSTMNVEIKVWERGFHGWIELPKSILEVERMEAFNTSVGFIMAVHRKHGFDIRKAD